LKQADSENNAMPRLDILTWLRGGELKTKVGAGLVTGNSDTKLDYQKTEKR